MPARAPSRVTTARKQEHVNIVLKRKVTFRAKTHGLEMWEFVHNALPELDFVDISTSTSFLGHTLAAPLMVSCMTGGYSDALRINRALAAVSRDLGIAMGVGSQRQALEDRTYHRTFSVVREVAPAIPVIGNIGAAEVALMKDAGPVLRLVDLVRADAIAVHLNPLQELLQPEGTPAFRGVLAGIAMLVRDLPVPVIVKEIGAGLSADVTSRLLAVGVRHIDVAGAGGTSWAGVEILRRKGKHSSPFWDWGIPTAESLQQIHALRPDAPQFTLIASGGISSGQDIATAIGLGADIVASAAPVLHALHAGGERKARSLLEGWIGDLRKVMFLTGSATVSALQRARMVRRAR
jgi:isopentenyl-diphosphate delta-isomerase